MRLEKKYFTPQTARRLIGLGILSVLSATAHSASTLPAACEGVKEGLIACYPFDGNTNDLSGKNYHGIAKNITYVEGQTGQAAHFDGKTSYVEIASNQDLNSPQITFATWIKPSTELNNKATSVDHSIIFNKESQYELAIFEGNYGTQVKKGELSFAFESHWDWMGTGASLPPNKFAHIALTYTKNNTAKLYVDGKLVKEQKYVRGLVTNPICVRIGARGCPSTAVYFFNGEMDEFRIYNRELSEVEVKQLAGVEPIKAVEQPIEKPIEKPVEKHTLSVVSLGSGKGNVQAEGVELNCIARECKQDYSTGSKITLVASPEPKNIFKEWGGDCSGNTQKLSVTIDKAKKCTAIFMLEQIQEPTPPPSTEASQLCVNVSGTHGQDRAAYCNDYAFGENNVPCVINKNGEIIAGECAQDQLNPKPLANKILPYAKHAFVGKSFSVATPRCDSSVEFSAESKIKAPSNMAFLCVRYAKTAENNSFYYGLAFVNNAQVLSYKFEATPDKCVGNCPK